MTRAACRSLLSCLALAAAQPVAVAAGEDGQQVLIEASVLEASTAALEETGVGFAGPVDLDRLVQSGSARVLAEPSQTTAAGEPTQIAVGGAASPSAGQPEPSGQEFRLELEIVPQLTPDGSIQMDVRPRVTQLDPATGIPGGLVPTPAVTGAIVPPGGSLVIGGLLPDDAPSRAGAVPWLGDVPVLGSLFKSQAFQRGETRLIILVSASVIDAEGGSRSSAPLAPAYTPTLEGGVLVQDLPSNSGGLGVVDVGGEEKFFITFPGSITGGLGGGSVMFWNPVPAIAGIPIHVNVGGWYGQGDDDVSKERAGEPGIVNGLAFWQLADNGSGGNAATGAGLLGQMDYELQAFQLRAKLLADITRPMDCLCDRLHGEDVEYDEEGPIRPQVRPVLRPMYLLEAGARVGYLNQDASQSVQLVNTNPGFSLFDVRSDTQLDLEEWSAMASFGLFHVRPIDCLKGLSAQVGFEAGLGYRDSSMDGRQRNLCDVRFAAAPGVNQCAPAVQDFTVRPDLDDSGFDWDLGASARLYYQIPVQRVPGLFVSLGWDFGYVGVSRVDAGPDVTAEGPVHLERTHQARNAVSLQVGITIP